MDLIVEEVAAAFLGLWYKDSEIGFLGFEMLG
jgi:hypothetical protein